MNLVNLPQLLVQPLPPHHGQGVDGEVGQVLPHLPADPHQAPVGGHLCGVVRVKVCWVPGGEGEYVLHPGADAEGLKVLEGAVDGAPYSQPAAGLQT